MASVYTSKLLEALDSKPELLEKILSSENEMVTTRGASKENSTLRYIFGNNVSSNELNQISKELGENPVVQLYLASNGALDAKDLSDYVGGFTGKKRGLGSSNQAVRSLFNGRLDISEIIILIVLLKLFKRKQSNTYNNSAIGLLGSLFGFNQYQSTPTGLFSGLLGNSSYNYGNNMFGNTYSNGLFQNTYNNGLSGFLGLGNTNYMYNNQSNNTLQNLLNFVNGNYNNNQQYYQLYNLLGHAAPQIVNNNGIVSSNGLFSLLSQLMGY